MEFRFDANQGFQVKAVEAAADLFDGPAPVSAQVRFKERTHSPAPCQVPSRFTLLPGRFAGICWGRTRLPVGRSWLGVRASAVECRMMF